MTDLGKCICFELQGVDKFLFNNSKISVTGLLNFPSQRKEFTIHLNIYPRKVIPNVDASL